MLFEVELTEANYGTVTVEANTKEEAEQKVLDTYLTGNIPWHDTDIEIEAHLMQKDCEENQCPTGK